MQKLPLTNAELTEQATKALRSFFVSSLRDLPAGFTWDYERVDSCEKGCAVSLAKYLGFIEASTTYSLAEVLGLPRRKVHSVCYHLHDRNNCHLRNVTADMVADAFEKLIAVEG